MSKLAFPLIVLVLVSIAAPQVSANEVVELTPIKDNALYEDSAGSLSNGAGTRMFAGVTLQPGLRRGLVAFDVAGNIPPDSLIVSATLTLEQVMSISGPFDVSLHRAEQDWGEGDSIAGGGQGAGGPAAPGDATWIHTFYDTDFWDTPGGNFVTTPSASVSIDGFGPFSWSSDLMVADVQGWLLDPDMNFGWVIVGDETTPGSAKTFSTREAPTGQPLLVIEYTPDTGCDGGTPVPAVSGWGALALALTLMILAAFALRRKPSRSAG